MTAIVLKRLTSFDFAVGVGYAPVYVNPAQLAYVQARRRRSPVDQDQDVLDGTLLYFQQEGGVLAVREDIDEVLAILAGRDYDRETKLDLTYEAARADLLP
jgi:hypothetical protein